MKMLYPQFMKRTRKPINEIDYYHPGDRVYDEDMRVLGTVISAEPHQFGDRPGQEEYYLIKADDTGGITGHLSDDPGLRRLDEDLYRQLGLEPGF